MSNNKGCLWLSIAEMCQKKRLATSWEHKIQDKLLKISQCQLNSGHFVIAKATCSNAMCCKAWASPCSWHFPAAGFCTTGEKEPQFISKSIHWSKLRAGFANMAKVPFQGHSSQMPGNDMVLLYPLVFPVVDEKNEWNWWHHASICIVLNTANLICKQPCPFWLQLCFFLKVVFIYKINYYLTFAKICWFCSCCNCNWTL